MIDTSEYPSDKFAFQRYSCEKCGNSMMVVVTRDKKESYYKCSNCCKDFTVFCLDTEGSFPHLGLFP